MLSLGWVLAKGQTVSPFSEDTCHIELNVLLTGEGKKALAKAQKASKKNKNQNALLKTLNSLQQIN